MLEYPLRIGTNRLFPLYLENRLHAAAIYSQRRPVRRRRKLASQVGRDRWDFIHGRKPLQQRRRPSHSKELLLDFFL